jgi:hypothetical protein
MSIAVSVVVYPSRILRILLISVALLVAGIDVAVIAGWLGELGLLPRTLAGMPIGFMAFFGFYHGVRHRKTLHIDISGAGQIRVAEEVSFSPCEREVDPHLKPNGTVVEMLDDSTLWPGLLVLRLRAGDGRVTVVPILLDCVSKDAFRALSVACRWVAARR